MNRIYTATLIRGFTTATVVRTSRWDPLKRVNYYIEHLVLNINEASTMYKKK